MNNQRKEIYALAENPQMKIELEHFCLLLKEISILSIYFAKMFEGDFIDFMDQQNKPEV